VGSDRALAKPKGKDLFAESLETIEATISGSRTFLLGFLRTAVYLAAMPHHVERFIADSTRPGRRTKPLTFMVVAVVGGSVALQTILKTLISELRDPDNTLQVTKLAKEVFEAYGALTFGQVILEALPITVLALLMTNWLVPLARLEEGLDDRFTEAVSYSIGLQFILILLASLISMPLMLVGDKPAVQIGGAIAGWIFVVYTLAVPGIIIGMRLRSLDTLPQRRKTRIVLSGLLVSSGLVLLNVGYILIRSTIAAAYAKASGPTPS
jgi:hypothetical protein